MPKTPWNTGASIVVSDLNESELKEAIKEWAEGSESLEELLWACYKNGIHTHGCDAGYHHFPYVSFDFEGEIEALKRIIMATWEYDGSEVFLKFVGNPYSGPAWHKPDLAVNPVKNKDADDFYKMLAIALKKKQEVKENKGFLHILKIYELLADCGIDISVCMKKSNDQYVIGVSCFGDNRNWRYLTKLLSEAGLQVTDKNRVIIKWGCRCSSEEEFEQVVGQLVKVLEAKYSLKAPTKITKDMSFAVKALVMQRRFGFDEKGIKQMNKWLNENKPLGINFRDVNY